MNIYPKNGIDKLLFGMKSPDVAAIYGKPDKEFRDEDGNVIQLYYELKCRLTFYEDEEFRLGYVIAAHPGLQLFGEKIVGRNISEVRQVLLAHGITKWETEEFDLAENHFDETNWLILQAEFAEVTKVEIGAIINDRDEFDWKFPVRKK
ncbi:hypothetical protein HYN48_14455 [Flavobacterium magnum]|uniref:Uncharacterized protein n=1 Tax=Flavobacterium magnum TaxID=2162713 RepID=A0A2S0RI26_9FLAO|nr:hypothetical protein [Flavobacterium magnum]AWA31199.1 hypothetical protein HYN48_14455 [Flavobacterium magnum]